MKPSSAQPLVKALLALLTLMSASGCWLGESTLGPEQRVVQLALVPLLSGPSRVGIADVRSIGIVLARMDGAVVVDDIRVLGSDESILNLDIPIQYSPPSETFTLDISLLNSSGEVVFTGGPMEVTVGGAGSRIEVPLTYVGVGFDAAFVSVDPPTVTLLEGESFTFTALAYSGNESVIPGTPIEWSSLDPTVASVPDLGSGLIQALALGTAEITATLLTGPSASAVVTVLPLPVLERDLATMSFDAQQGGANPASQTLRISNGGNGTLSWSVSDDQPWLSLSPTTGTSTGEAADVTVSVDIARLAVGTYDATITTVGQVPASGSPQTTAVALAITATPEAPRLSNLTVPLIELNGPICSDVNGGSLFGVSFDFTDANADVTSDGSVVTWSLVFNPSGNNSTFAPNLIFTGTPSAGTISWGLCSLFDTDLSQDITVSLTDDAGLTSDTLSVSVQRPSGANVGAITSAEPSASRRSAATAGPPGG